jgi:hypothetical protein
MKKTIILSSLIFSLLLCVNSSNAANLATTLKGKILLQVEQNGKAWYVNPSNETRYFLGRPADAFNVMRELGLGISNKDFNSFNGYAPSRLSGKILLNVEDGGKAYYVNPGDLKMHYLGRPSDAFRVMRELGLGITDKNLSLISEANNEIPSNWKTWRNDLYGFSVRYPGKENVHIKATDDIKGMDPGGLEYFLGEEENGIRIFPIKPEEKFNIDSWVSKHILSSNPDYSKKIYYKQTLFINGHNAFQLDTKGDVGVDYEPFEGGTAGSLVGKDMRFIVIKGPDRFIITWFPLADKYGKNFFDTYSKMISSLKFVD